MSDDDKRVLADARNLSNSPCALDPIDQEIVADLVALAERLTAEIDKLTLRWSSERPTVVGWYFLRNTADGVTMNLWWIDEEDMATAWAETVEFAGPIAASTLLEPDQKGGAS